MKTPRSGGFTNEYYQRFKNEIIPLLLKLRFGLTLVLLPPNSYAEALTPNVMVFGVGVFMR